MVATRPRPRGAGRAQLHEAALRLFVRDGVEGTSLQAIADEMGVSKAAVYYHYKTKDDLVLAVVAPLVDQLLAIADDVQAQGGRAARVETFLTRLVDFIVAYPSSHLITVSDPYVGRLLVEQHALRQWWERIIELLGGGPEPDVQTRVACSMLVGGLAQASRDHGLAALEPAVLRDHLLQCARRLLKVRRPAAPPPTR
jgi:AcrR family transcriptional regulator